MAKETNISKEHLQYLLDGLTGNTISRGELEELTGYLHSLKNENLLDASLEQVWANISNGTDHEEINSNLLYENIISDSRFRKPDHQPQKVSVLWTSRMLRYVASLILLSSLGIWFFLNKDKQKTTEPEEIVTSLKQDTIAPNQHAVLLTLADGSRIVLGKDSDGTLAIQGDSRIEQEEGQIAYKDIGLGILGVKPLINTVTTPKGNDFKIVLPDGTKVWLNTLSTISYPVVFDGKERKVKIIGEAYFEVARNPYQPFIVEANGTEVRVLGTHFNVSAYSEENTVKTTLIEGAVKVTNKGQSALLKPGEQSIASLSKSNIEVNNIDVEEALAWKNGYFLFNNENIKTVMKSIARWYDITVEYEGNVGQKTFGGTIERFATIEQLLKSMEMTGAIHFKILPSEPGKERRVVVMP